MRITALVLIIALLVLLCSCTQKDTDITPAPTPDNSVSTSYTTESGSSDTAPSEDVEPSADTVTETSYIGALTDEQKAEILQFAEKWYEENFSEYEVLSMDFAEDDDDGYLYYSDKKPGEIIILIVHTTHGSRVKNGEIQGIPRRFIIGITDSGYERINEGY